VKISQIYPILYSFRRCPYAIRARLALSISGQVCELREVVLGNKPPELLAASPKGTVPVLIDPGGRVLDESLEIMVWALEQQDPEQWLLPEQGSRGEMQALIALFDDRFKFHLDRYKYPQRYEDSDPQTDRTQAAVYLERLNQRLSVSPHLFGNAASLADMAIFPFVRQFAQTDLDWFNGQDWRRLQTWLVSLVSAQRYALVMEKYPAWKSGQPGIVFPGVGSTNRPGIDQSPLHIHR
jgi:glutathione S-transferase